MDLIINLAPLRPISTAKFVPRSHGYTWLILAKYNAGMGVWMEGILCEWLSNGTGWAYLVRYNQVLLIQLCSNLGLKRLRAGRKRCSNSSWLNVKYSWSF